MDKPFSVVMTLDDGEVVEEMFSSQYLAELFVTLLPTYLLPDGRRVVEAILSPLETQAEMTTFKTGN